MVTREILLSRYGTLRSIAKAEVCREYICFDPPVLWLLPFWTPIGSWFIRSAGLCLSAGGERCPRADYAGSSIRSLLGVGTNSHHRYVSCLLETWLGSPDLIPCWWDCMNCLTACRAAEYGNFMAMFPSLIQRRHKDGFSMWDDWIPQSLFPCISKANPSVMISFWAEDLNAPCTSQIPLSGRSITSTDPSEFGQNKQDFGSRYD